MFFVDDCWTQRLVLVHLHTAAACFNYQKKSVQEGWTTSFRAEAK